MAGTQNLCFDTRVLHREPNVDPAEVLLAMHILELTSPPICSAVHCSGWQAFQGSPANFGGAVRRIRQACLSSDGSVTPKEQTFLTLFLVRCVQHLVSHPAR